MASTMRPILVACVLTLGMFLPAFLLPTTVSGGKTETFSSDLGSAEFSFSVGGGNYTAYVKLPTRSEALTSALSIRGDKIPTDKGFTHSTQVDFAQGTFTNNVTNGVDGIQRDPMKARFGTMVPYTAGPGPVYLTIGDVNNDGRKDVVVSLQGANATGIFHQKTDGTLDTMVSLDAGAATTGVAVGDVTGDGLSDIVVATVQLNWNGTISVFPQAAAGGFDPRVDYRVGGYPDGVGIGDLNSDGKKDVAVANWASGSVGLLLQNPATGKFYNCVNYSAGRGPMGLVVGDVNSDGKDDVVVALNDENVTGLMYQGLNNQLMPITNVTAGGWPVRVALGDVNNDGRRDILVTNSGTNNTGLYLQNPDGTLRGMMPFMGSGSEPRGVATGDINNDSRPDFVVTCAWPGADKIDIFAEDHMQVLRQMQTIPSGTAPYSVAIADLTGDGMNDIVVANAGSGNIGVYVQKPFSGTFTSQAYSWPLKIISAKAVWSENLRGTPVQVSLSNDNGGNWVPVTNGTETTFTTQGNALMYKVQFDSATTLTRIQVVYTLETVYPTDLALFVGDETSPAWSQSGPLSTTATIPDFSTRFTTYVSKHAADADGENNISVPLKFVCSSAGLVNISGISVTFNVPPFITEYAPKTLTNTINEGDTLNFSINATDTDRDAMTYTWKVDGTAQSGTEPRFSYSPDFDAAGTHNITAAVSDGRASTSRTWEVKVKDVNRPPELKSFTPAGDPGAREGQTTQFKATIEDPDGDDVTVEWYLDMLRVATQGTGSASYDYRPWYMEYGDHNVTLSASDGEFKVVHTWLFNVAKVNLLNDPAYATPAGNVSLDEGQSQTFTADLNAIKGIIGNTSVRWTLDSITCTTAIGGEFVYSADYQSSGEHNLSVLVQSGQIKFLRNWKITVREVTNAPVIDNAQPAYDPGIREGESVEFKVAAHDPDGDALMYKWYNNGTEIPGANKASYKYSASWTSKGTYPITVVVSDGKTSVSKTWSLLVQHAEKSNPGFGGANFMYVLVGVIVMIVVVGCIAFYAYKRSDKVSKVFDRSDSKLASPESVQAGPAPKQELPSLTPPPKPKATYPCPHCGGIVEEDWFLCHHCSNPLKGGTEMPKAADGTIGKHEEKATEDAMKRSQLSTETPTCPKCGKMLNPAWDACPDCGQVIREKAAPQDEAKAAEGPKCPFCGEGIDAQWKMCPACGKEFARNEGSQAVRQQGSEAATGAQPAAPPAPSQPQPAPTQEQPAASPVTAPKCPHCGTEVDAAWNICPECSGKLK